MEVRPLDAVFERLGAAGVAAVVMIEDEDAAVPLARALLAGGVGAMELTLRSEAALESLARIAAEVPGMLLGAGTVLDAGQVAAVKAAGASFGVAPGTSARVIEAAAAAGLPFAPGIATPSDIELAVSLGCRVLKFFPADGMGGWRYLRGIAAPYRHLGLRYIPLGGVNPGNLAEYLAQPEILAVGGSWLAPAAAVRDGEWTVVEDLAAQARMLVAGVRAEARE